MASKKEHDLFDRFLGFPGPLDHGHTPLANTGDFDEAGARVFDDVQCLQAEVFDNAFGCDRPDAFDEPAAQIFFQPCQRGWFHLLSMEALELTAIFGMFAPQAGQAQRLTRMNLREPPNDGHEIALPRHREAKHSISTFVAVKGHALNNSLYIFDR